LCERSSLDFDVDLSLMDHVPTAEDPVVVPPGESVLVNVLFVPDVENPVDEDGELVLDEGVLRIDSNAMNAPTDLPVHAAGVLPSSPTAVIHVAEGNEVIPQTILHLYGDESFAPNGTIQKWEWDVEQPVGSMSVFVPSHTFPNPTFEANVAGVYTFYLTVYDQSNTPSCFPAAYEVVVIPCESIHIELLWHTPGDLDETDTGPENIDLDIPENVVYRVGVNYWKDHGYGPAFVTVRVYVYGRLVFEVADVELVDRDMWEVCTVEWPSGKVQMVKEQAGEYKIVHDYLNPYFVQ
jgi:hypothetical protein